MAGAAARLGAVGLRSRLLLLLAATFLAEAFIAVYLFHGYPYSQDEWNYLFQAEIFSSGRIYLPMEEWRRFLATDYTIVKDGRLYSKYPAGFPAVLSLGVLLGAPALVNPLLSAITIFLLYALLRRQFGARTALLMAAVVAANSWFMGYGASLFSQSLTLTLSTLCLLLLKRWLDEGRAAHLAQAGMAAGLAFWVRPLDGFCLMLALGAACFAPRLWPLVKRGLLLALPFGLCVLGLYTYHWIQAECFCIASYAIWNREFHLEHESRGNVFLYLANLVGNYWFTMRVFTWPVFYQKFIPFAGPGFVALVALGMWRLRGPMARACFAHIASMVLLYNFHSTIGFPVYGVRYWYPCIAALAFFAASGMAWLAPQLSRRAGGALAVLLLAYQLFQAAGDMETYARRFTMTLSYRDQIMHQCPEPSLILMVNPLYQEPQWPEYILPWDLRRNGDMMGPTLFVRGRNQILKLAPHYPDSAFCHYTYQRGTLPMPELHIPHLNWNLGKG